MTNQEKQFLQLAIIDQLKYDEISTQLQVERKQLSIWWDELKEERERLSNIRRIWKYKRIETDFWTFEKWYTETAKECHYCKVSESQLAILNPKDNRITKRNRGTRLEIDRKQADLSYDQIDNLVFSCYWCNNAKTDTFTEEEFKVVGQAIGEVWQRRLDKLEDQNNELLKK